MEGCVDINSPVFKQFCKDYEVSEGQMEIWIKSWWKTHDDGSFPDEDFINKKKYGESIEMSDEGIAAYSSEFVESGSPFYEIEDRNMAKSYYEYLKKRFDQRAIGAYTRADGKIVISVAKPKVSPDSKLKDLKIPTIGSKIVFPDGDIRTVTGVTVEQRLGRIHVRFGNNETIGTTLFMDKDNPNRFYYMKGKPNAYDKPDPTRYYIKIEGPTSLYYEGRYEVASNNVNPNTTSKESTEHVPSTINIYSGTRENAELSNFANRPFQFIGKTVSNVEAAFQAFKFLSMYDYVYKKIKKEHNINNDRKLQSDLIDLKLAQQNLRDEILKSNGPTAKSKGRTSLTSKNPIVQSAINEFFNTVWNQRKAIVAKRLMKKSFMSNPDALKRLLDTGDATLTHTQGRDGWDTLFPRLLTEIREELRQEANTPKTKKTSTPAPSTQVSKEEGEEILSKAKRDSKGNLLAPNGNISNLSEDNYVLVRTKAFKDWFGDWERIAPKTIFKKGDTIIIGDSNFTVSRVEKDSNYNVPIVYVKESLQTRKGGFIPSLNVVIVSEINTDEETIKHELIHSKEYNIDTSSLNNLYEKVKQIITDDSFIDGVVTNNFRKNIHEFIADALTKSAFRNALKKEGILDEVETAINNIIEKTPKDDVSKVVDENGEPLLVYHGTNAQFDEFRIDVEDRVTGEYIYTDPVTAEEFTSDSVGSLFFSDSYGVGAQYGILGNYNQFERKYALVRNAIGTLYDGGFSAKDFKSIDEFIDFLESLSEYNPRFINLVKYMRKNKEEGKKLTQAEKDAIMSMMMDVEKQMKAIQSWTFQNATDYLNILTEDINFLKKYNNPEGLQRLLNGEIPSSLTPSVAYDLNLTIGYRSDRIGDYHALYTDDNGDLIIRIGDNEYKVKDLSKEELGKHMKTLAEAVKAGIVNYNADINFARLRRGATVFSSFLNIKEPFDHDYEGTMMGGGYKGNKEISFGYIAARQRKRAAEQGKDGMIYRNIQDPYLADNYAVFDASQIMVVGREEPQVGEVDEEIFEKLERETQEAINKAKETKTETLEVLGGTNDPNAKAEFDSTIVTATAGIALEEALKGVNPIFNEEEQAQIKEALKLTRDGKLRVMSVSRQTDPVFFSKEIVKFIEENAKKSLADPTRVNVIEIWTKHDGEPIQDILEACKKYKVAPMVSFSITGLGNTALEQGVMKYQDLLDRVEQLVKAGALNPATTTVRIDPILVGETKLEDIKAIVEKAKSIGIKKFVTSLVQSYGYLDGTARDRKVTSGINNALAKEGRTYDWDKYYGRDASGKINFKPKKEYIEEIGNFLLELNKDPDIEIETCAFPVKGLKNSACLDPLIIERVTGVDVTSPDGKYKKDTSRKDCMCYGAHSDMFRPNEKKCFSSCAYCYAAHSGDNNLNYYNEDGTIKDNPYTRVRINQEQQQKNMKQPTDKNDFQDEDQKFINESVALRNSLTALQTSKVMTASEAKDVADQMVNFISDMITDILENKNNARENWSNELKDIDFATASRIDIARAIGPKNLIDACKNNFLKAQSDARVGRKTAAKVRLILNNWNALMQLASNTFIANEKFTIDINDNSDNSVRIVEDKYIDADNLNDPNDTDDVNEVEGSAQEHWQIETRTMDVLENATALVRHALRGCFILDSNGNPELTEFGIKKRVKIQTAVSSILRWTQGAQTLSDMIDMLKNKADSNPWINQIIERLEKEKGDDVYFQSQFFNVFCKRWQGYSVVKAFRDSDGKITFKSIPVNTMPALKEAVNSVVNQYKIGQHPLFTSQGVNTSALAELDEANTELQELRSEEVNDENLEAISKNIGFALHTLGYYASLDDIIEAVKDVNSRKKMIDALNYMVSSLSAHKNDSNYQPFGYKTDGSILGNLRELLTPIADRLEDTAISSFYEDGKMYQSYTVPSYLTNLLSKFHTSSEENFINFISKQYGVSEWFKRPGGDVDSGWRNPWLSTMMKNPKARRVFDHKVQLSFNRQAYMTEMDDLQYTLSIMAEFFSTEVGEGESEVPAWFRVPMLSNKTSSEYIKFYRKVGDRYRESIVNGMSQIMLQEISRIRTVKIRNLDESSPEYIKNWDGERGKSFTFITFLNDYLEGGSKANSELGELLAAATSKEGISDAKQETLIKKAKEVIMESMQERVTSVLEEYKREGIVEAAKKLEHIGTTDEEVLANLENFVWNDTFAAMNILQLTIGDTAFYSDTVDLQKRFAQIHAPGIRPNKEAKDQYGNRVADDYSRTMVLNDFEDVRSNVIENVEVVFDRKIENATTPAERAFYENLKNEIIDGFNKINVTDAQAYNCPTSYRKKAIMFGKWDKRVEELFKKVQEGNYTYQELQETFQIFKPFAYTQTAESVGKEGSPISTMPIPFQNKNSEYLLIMADAILKGEDTGKPNLLRAIFEVMEESAKEDPTKGIDTVQFKSAVKSGSHGVIDIHQFLNKSNGERMAKEHLLNAIYKLENIEVTDKQTGEKYTTVRRSAKYNRNHVRFIDWMDYGLQQEVPSHFNQHYQAHGSQIRAITISDLSLDATFMGMPTKEFAKEYEKTIAENIQESIKEIEESFRLSGTRKERNIALSKILRREVASSSRYGIDLMQAVLLDENGEFNMPLGDPIQARRIEQLLNSIIKNTVNKQTIAGGPVVQVSCFGTSRDLNIRFKDKSDPSGKTLLMTKKEWEESKDKKHKSYKDYIKENQGGIAYFEVYAPIYANELLTKFISPDGTIDVEAIEAVDPELLKMIGYRIPTEDKYSCAPLKIVGFLPREAGDGIMLPADITLLSGSDFDVDKMYLMRKEILIAERFEDKTPITDETSPEVKDYLEHNRTSAAAHLKKVLADTINLDEYFNNVAESISKKYVVDRKLIAKHRKEELEEAERRSALFEEANAKKLSEELAEAEKKNSLIEATNEEEEKEKQEKLEKAKEKIEARYKVTQDKEKKRLERVKKNIENKYREQINDSYGREHKETEKAQLRALNVTVDEFILTKTYNVPLNKLSGLDRLLKTEYLKYVYKTIYPVKGRAARNNKIIDMTYEVLTHEDSADKILNPGGFEPEKRMGYMIQAYRTGRYKWEDLKKKPVKELKKLVMSDDNLAFIDTHVQFYKQNSAAAALIGVCAVHKVSHAFIERDPIYLDFSEATKYKVPFKLGNTILKGKVKIDPTRDSSGNYVGRTLGSLVASSADAAKDPVLNLMNINKSTINILTTAVRLGIPFEDAALLLSQESFRRIVTEQNRKRLKGEPSSLQSLVSERINTISKEAGFKTDEDKSKILEEGLTEGELVSGLVLTSKNTEFKALSMIKALLEAGKNLKGITTATKQNSISNSVGPLIIDNHMLEYKMQDFSEFIYIRNEITGIDSRVENINGIFELHPMLGSFKEGIRLAREIFSEMPIARFDFTKLINSFELLGTTDIMSDRRLLGKLADFYTSYLLVNSGVINPEECRYYIEDFPKELFGKENNIKDKYRGNPLIDALKLNVDNNTGFVSIKVDTTGLDTEQKDVLISGYIDLLSKDKELAIKLFKYNFFRGGIGFNPKTFMNLTPIFLKEAIEGYKETFSKSVETNAEDVMDLFIRNTWEDNSAVKFLDYKSKDYDGKDITNYYINDDGSITILEESVYNRYKNYGYIKIKVGKEYKLYKRLEDDSDSKILFYRELTPLGNHNAYLEFTDEPIKLSDNITPEDDNGGGLRNLKRDNLEGTQDNDSGTPEVSLDLVKRAFIRGAGLSADKTELKLAEFKAKSKEEKSNLERSTKDFLAKQFSKLNIRFNEDSLDKIFKLMC